MLNSISQVLCHTGTHLHLMCQKNGQTMQLDLLLDLQCFSTLEVGPKNPAGSTLW